MQNKYSEEMVRMVEKKNHHFTIMEYRSDIHNHLVQLDFELEENPSIAPIQDQVKILRCSILNSLLDVCYRLNWTSSTFSLAVHLFDTYTTNTTIEINNCRLIGFCCLWISSKYNENKPKGNILNALIKRAGYDQSSKKTFLKIEFNILKSINWDLSYPTPELFLDVFLNTGEPNNLERRLGSMFLCDLSLFNLDIVSNYSSSSIAASSIMITNFAMLNLRHKHIRQHRFDQLESLILTQVVKMENSIKLKYLDNNIISHSNNNMVIHNLIYLAQCFVRQIEEKKKLKDLDFNNHLHSHSNLYYNSSGYMLSNDTNGNLSNFPISPMASPTNLPNSSFIRSSNNSRSQIFEHDDNLSSNSSSSSSKDLDNNNNGSTGGRHSRSQSLRNILPTPGTTPTASFNWMSTSSGSIDYCSSASSTNNTGSINEIENSQQNIKSTPQIFTPVQLLPHPLLCSLPHTHLHPLYSQRYDYSRSHTPENVLMNKSSVRTKYQRTLPVLTRSRAKEFVTDSSDAHDVKRRKV